MRNEHDFFAHASWRVLTGSELAKLSLIWGGDVNTYRHPYRVINAERAILMVG